MRYVGGKHYQADMIARQIQVAGRGRRLYVEPFVGGGAVLVKVPRTFERYAGDVHPDLIAMYQALAAGWHPPTAITEAQYKKLKNGPPSPDRTFAGFAASFGAQWLHGYGRTEQDIVGGTARWLEVHADTLAEVIYAAGDYRTTTAGLVGPDTVIYADPPYDGTYPYQGVRPFSTAAFWKVAQSWVEAGAVVLVSEYQAPPHWLPVRTRVRPNKLRIQQKGTVTHEMLYRSPNESVHSVNRSRR